MIILDLYAGLGGERRRYMIESRGHTLVTLDLDPAFGCTVSADILSFYPELIDKLNSFGKFDMIWASPPCEAFSVAAIGRNWDNATREPKTNKARLGIAILTRTIDIINDLNPKYYYIENPRGMMRTLPMMKQFNRATVTYCQYGLNIMKPTDIWTNDINFAITARSCKNGSTFHESAPRGARTGTQGIKGSAERAVVPLQLWDEILSSIEKSNREGQTIARM